MADFPELEARPQSEAEVDSAALAVLTAGAESQGACRSPHSGPATLAGCHSGGRRCLSDRVAAATAALLSTPAPEVQARPIPASKRPLKASERVAQCGKRSVVVKCSHCTGEKPKLWAVPVRCHSRFCRPCSRAKSAKWSDWADSVEWKDPHMLVLTSIAGPDVAASVDLVLESFAKLRRKLGIVAGVRGLEVKASPHGWYVHLHTFIDGWQDIEAVRAEWFRMTGAVQCWIVWVNGKDREAVRAAIREVVKYGAVGFGKDSNRLTPEQIDELAPVLRYRRMVSHWGKFTPAAAGPSSMLDTTATIQPGLTCPDCGSALVRCGIVATEACSDLPRYVWPVKTRAGPAALAAGSKTEAVTAAPLAPVTLRA